MNSIGERRDSLSINQVPFAPLTTILNPQPAIFTVAISSVTIALKLSANKNKNNRRLKSKLFFRKLQKIFPRNPQQA
jgi:hypothetical protein